MAEDNVPASPASPDGAQNVANPSNAPSSFLAPSDFLPNLPPSTETPSSASRNDNADGEDAPMVLGPDGRPRPTVDAQGRTLNPRSCVTCRRRKVRCDKLHPCGNCTRAHIECVFPAPGRAPRKSRKIVGEGRDKELLERLRRLEGVVKGMGVEVPDKENNTSAQHDTEHTRQSSVGSAQLSAQHTPAAGTQDDDDAEQEFATKTRQVESHYQGRLENRFGRLVVNEGKSRYINNSFWANLSNEVEDLKGILNQSSDEDEIAGSSPSSQNQLPTSHHGFIFGFSSQNVDLLSLHPLAGQISEYWAIYKDRVDPLCKVLHIPTLEPTILSAASHLSNLSRGFECLLFTMYYGVVTSLPPHECLLKLGEEKSVLLTRYRFAVEQALARANFLTTEEIVVLQSFVIFLICLRRNSDARVIWTLTGLVVRIAQTIGIHRDGSHFGLAPFEVEIRRRLWWQVCILDVRASEDHGCDPTIVEQSYDTQMPLNINDVDMTPKMKDYPPERQGCTDMTFCLLRFEVSNTFRRINYVPPRPIDAKGQTSINTVTLADKERWITECHERLEERYLKHCDMSVPLYWVTATVARLMMSKLWLMVYHPFQRTTEGGGLSPEIKEKLFITSLENLEYSILLETEARTMKWGWLFKTYMQWHAFTFILSELCHRTTGDLADRAWSAIQKTRDGRWGDPADAENSGRVGHLWRPLRKLYQKALEARQRGLQEEQIAKGMFPNAPARTYSPNAHPMFSDHNKARVTRAPLSQAQLRRFTEGPTYGRTPLDKHEMLRSPRLSPEATEDPMEAAGLAMEAKADPSARTADQNFSPSALEGVRAAQFGMPANSQSLDCGQAQPLQTRRTFGQNFLGNMNIDFDDTPGTLDNTMANPPSDGLMSMNSIDSLDQGVNNIMDTSGDVDWESWDRLVRTFGMDVDSGAGSGNTANWNGPNFEMGNSTSGQNLRMGMGMGLNDWF